MQQNVNQLFSNYYLLKKPRFQMSNMVKSNINSEVHRAVTIIHKG